MISVKTSCGGAKSINFILMSLCVILLIACSQDTPLPPPPSGPNVSVITIEAKDTPVSFEYIAQTQSSHLVNIQARVNGFVEKQVYTEGEMVKKDQILFYMDEKPFQTQVNAAKAALNNKQAALENARLNLARVKPLAEQNALAQKDLDDANSSFATNAASVDEANAQLDTAMLNLSYCTITAPIDGLTSAALKQEGTYLNISDSKLMTVSTISPMWVNFSLSENQLQKVQDEIQKGQLIIPKNKEFDVKVIQTNGKIFPNTGKITFTEPYFNAKTGTFLIRASVDNPEGVLKANQYVRSRIEGAIRPKSILIPQRAVQQSAKGLFVWVVNKEKKAEYRPIVAGDWHEGNWFILEGLQSGEQVITDGTMKLYPGSPITIQPS